MIQRQPSCFPHTPSLPLFAADNVAWPVVDQVLVLHPHTLSLGWTIQESEVEPKLAKLPSELIGQWTTQI